MIDGYYLSTYLHIDPLAYIYEVSLRHDQAIALWHKEGDHIKLVRYWELERKTGIKKHSISFYSREHCLSVIENLLNEVDLELEDIEDIWGTPGIEKSEDSSSYSVDMECPLHSLCHLFSGIMVNSNTFYEQQIVAFALDGGPDNVTDRYAREKNFYWGVYCNKGVLNYFPVPSPGAFWSFMRIRFKMEEGSLMALGEATKAQLPEENRYLKQAPKVFKGNDFNLAFHWIEQIIEETNNIQRDKIIEYDEHFSETENRISMAVKIVQKASFEILENVMIKIIKDFGIEPSQIILSMTGGFALNCPSNSFLMRRFGFKCFETCPCVNDSGIALGLGLYEFYSRMKYFNFSLENAYYGSCEQKGRLFSINSEWIQYIESTECFSPHQFADDILKEPLIWFYGNAEIGPRALGARSILGNPSDEKTNFALNQIKQRQWWRPVAPIILQEEKEKWFKETFDSPYMLCTSYVIPEKKGYLPSALHLDDSARIQTLKRENNPLLYDGIKAFYKRTGVPVICNTSLNDRGEPIVDCYDECLNFALRKGINIVYIDGIRVKLQHHNQYKESLPFKREFGAFELSEKQKEEVMKKYNPFELSAEEVDLYLNIPELSDFDITNRVELSRLRRILCQWKRLDSTIWSALLL